VGESTLRELQGVRDDRPVGRAPNIPRPVKSKPKRFSVVAQIIDTYGGEQIANFENRA
jgi:hypothetical protein